MVYAPAILICYLYCAFRWPAVSFQQAEAALKDVSEHILEWQIFWWVEVLFSLSLIPAFPALFYALSKHAGSWAAVAVFFGITAIIFGLLGPLRHATVTPVLAKLYTESPNEIMKLSGVSHYLANEAYGEGLFCLFGTTCLVGWVGLGGWAMLQSPLFSGFLGQLGIVVGGLWILRIIFKVLSHPPTILSALILIAFASWVFLTGWRLVQLSKIQIQKGEM